MKRVLDFTEADIDNPETLNTVLFEPLAVLGIEVSDEGKKFTTSAWNRFVHGFYLQYDIHKHEQYPKAKDLDQLIKQAEKLRLDVASHGREDLQRVENELLVAQSDFEKMKRHREAKPKSETVYPPGIVLLAQLLIKQWDDWMRIYEKKGHSNASVKSHSPEVDSTMDRKLHNQVLTDVNIQNNPGGAFIQRAFRHYWGIDYTTAQMKILIQKAMDSSHSKEELKKHEMYIPKSVLKRNKDSIHPKRAEDQLKKLNEALKKPKS